MFCSISSYYEKILATGEVKCIDEEVPFEIPQGWEWCRLKHICSMQAGKNISACKIFSDKSASHPYRCVGGNGLRGYTENFNTNGHYSIVGRQGALCGCVNIEIGKFYATEHAVVVDTYEILSPLFMYFFLTALNLNKYATATAQPGLAVSNVLEVMCPLPPLKEGEHIIKKLSLLIPLIENYNVIQEKQDMLNCSINEQLKKSILQEAIQGKLVPQIAEEGTAQELLEQIKVEKLKLVKEGKLKKSALATSVIFRSTDNKYYTVKNKEEVCIDDEIPFDIPNTWGWCYFSDIANSGLGKTMDKGKNSGAFVPYLCSINVYWDKIDLSTIKQAQFSEIEREKYLLRKNDLLICEGGDIGRTAIWENESTMYYQNALHRVRFFGNIQPRYFMYVIALYKALGILESKSKGMTIKHFTKSALNSMVIPLPPIMEQERIVHKIEQLSQLLK